MRLTSTGTFAITLLLALGGLGPAGLAHTGDPGDDPPPGASEPVTVDWRGKVQHGGNTSIDDDGSRVAFRSGERRLLEGEVVKNSAFAYLRDRDADRSMLLERLPDGTPPGGSPTNIAVQLSGDGRFAVVSTWSRDLDADVVDDNRNVDVYLVDTVDGKTEHVSHTPSGHAGDSWSSAEAGSVTENGGLVVFGSLAEDLVPGDDNGYSDVFLYDRSTEHVRLISSGPDGEAANGGSRSASISSDGRWVAFESGASNLVSDDRNGETDIFVADLQTGAMQRISRTPYVGRSLRGCWNPKISGDGETVAFVSSVLHGDDRAIAVFAADLTTGAIRLVSRTLQGTPAPVGPSTKPDISDDGRVMVYESSSDQVVPGDDNASLDAFAVDLETGRTILVTRLEDGSFLSEGGEEPSISGDGRLVAYTSESDELLHGEPYAASFVTRLDWS